MINCLIIDDEKDCRDSLSKIIQRLPENVSIVGEAENIDEADQIIYQKKPQLIFLDIEMPGGSGFDLLKKFIDPAFAVVFTTAHDSYALRAIKFCALDYLLKPISTEDVDSVFKKLSKKQNFNFPDVRLRQMTSNLRNYGSKRNKIALKTTECIEFLEVDIIVCCKADGNYTRFFLNNEEEKLVVGKIKEFEEILTDHDFIRVHNSYIVNINMIKKFIKSDGGYFELKNGMGIPISRRKKYDILNQIMNTDRL